MAMLPRSERQLDKENMVLNEGRILSVELLAILLQ
jgi:hypothetical protein